MLHDLVVDGFLVHIESDIVVDVHGLLRLEVSDSRLS